MTLKKYIEYKEFLDKKNLKKKKAKNKKDIIIENNIKILKK